MKSKNRKYGMNLTEKIWKRWLNSFKEAPMSGQKRVLTVSTVQALPTDPEVYSCVFDIPWTGVNVYVKVVAEDGAGLTCQTSPIMTPIYISSSGGTIGLSEAITVYFPEGTVFDDTKVVLKKVSLSSDMDDSSLGKYIKPGAKARVAFSLEIGDEFSVRYVPQSLYFQSQELSIGGFNLDSDALEKLNRNKEATFKRMINPVKKKINFEVI